MANYRAIRTCFHRQFHYMPGDPYVPTAEEIENNSIPEHFVKSAEFSPDAVVNAEKEDRLRTAVIKPEKKKKKE
jgi:hypothetical protein